MKGRVDALIKKANEIVVQVVRADVSSPNPGQPIELTEIMVAPPVLTGPMIEEIILDDLEGRSPTDEAALSDLDSSEIITSNSPGAWFEVRYGKTRDTSRFPSRDINPNGTARDIRLQHLHDIFGSEGLAFPWLDTLSVTSLSTHQSADQEIIDIISSAQTGSLSQTADGVRLHQVQIHFRLKIDDPIGHIVTMNDECGRCFGCVLPRDIEQINYMLEIDVESGGTQNSRFIRFAVFLSPQNSESLSLVARAWDKLRAINAAVAAETLQAFPATNATGVFRDANRALGEKRLSPLAATVGAILLLKGNRFDLMHDWTRNVGNWFPWIPDGVVLWTEQCRRLAAGQTLDPTLISWFVKELSHRCLPFTVDAFGFAIDILREVLRPRVEIDDETRKAAKILSERFDAAMPYFRDGGLFCGYAAWPVEMVLEKVIGLPPIVLEMWSPSVSTEGKMREND